MLNEYDQCVAIKNNQHQTVYNYMAFRQPKNIPSQQKGCRRGHKTA